MLRSLTYELKKNWGSIYE